MFRRLDVLARYVAAGSLAVTVHYLVLILLVEGGQVGATLSSTCGFTAGLLVNYPLQYYWTFGSSGSHAKRFPLFAAAALAMLGLNAAVFWGLHEHGGVHYLAAQAVAILAAFLFNFLINSRYTFAPDRFSSGG